MMTPTHDFTSSRIPPLPYLTNRWGLTSLPSICTALFSQVLILSIHSANIYYEFFVFKCLKWVSLFIYHQMLATLNLKKYQCVPPYTLFTACIIYIS